MPPVVLPGASAAAFSSPQSPHAIAPSPVFFAAQEALLAAVAAGRLAPLPPPAVDAAVWQLEHLRLLVAHLNVLVGRRAAAGCTPTSCAVMATGDVQYLCASHPSPRECCALDYAVHTLDASSALLNSSTAYPSRLSVSPAGAAHFSPLSRRLYRVLSHAARHHAAAFAPFEAETRCAGRLTALARAHGLLTEEQLLIPHAELAGDAGVGEGGRQAAAAEASAGRGESSAS